MLVEKPILEQNVIVVRSDKTDQSIHIGYFVSSRIYTNKPLANVH